jgi:uncharacterized membrane protein YccC
MIRDLAARAFKIDRNALEPVFAIRCAIGVTVTLLGAYATGQPILAVAGAFGAMSTGFGSLQGVYRTRAATMMSMALAMAFSTGIGLLVAHSALLTIAALAAWGFAYGLTASLGPAISAIGVNATLALIIFEHFPQRPALGIESALMMIAGGAVQTLLLVVLWPFQRYPQERHALATAYRQFAAFAASSDGVRVPPSAPLTAVRAALADPRPFGRRTAATAFQTLLDEAQRIRESLALLVAANGAEYAAARPAIASALREIADALDEAREPADAGYARLQDEHDDPTLRALFGQLRAAWRAAGVPLRGFAIPRLSRPKFFSDWEEPISFVRAHVTFESAFFRHAVRLAVVLSVAGTVEEVFSLQRGYWITLTAALVLRPDFTTTFTRGLARIGGTIAGVIAATLIVLAVPNTPHMYLALAIFFAAIGYAAFQLNYALFSFTVTAYVVFLLALLGVPEHYAVVNRLFATLVGGTLAMASYLLWPTWEGGRLRSQLRALSEASIDYTRAMLDALAGDAPRDLSALQRMRAKVWSIRASADESLERMLSEPESTHEFDRHAAVGIMAATQRLGLANAALSGLYSDPQTPAFACLRPIAQRLHEDEIEKTGGLRDASFAAEHELARDDRSQAQALRSALDLTIDSINTLVELWATAGEDAPLRESPGRA